MNKSKEFDKYFQYSYFNELNEKVGVFSKDTPSYLIQIVKAKKMFDILEFEYS